MKISLVICTRNRASKLSVALEKLLSLEYDFPWELVVVDNGSTDETRTVVETFRLKFPQQMLYAVEPGPGLGRARNLGWKTAGGDLIAFTDDDCYPATDFLDATYRCFAESDHIGFAGGRVLLYDQTDYRISIQEHDRNQKLLPKRFIRTGLIQGANLICRRAALDSVGGFDNRLGLGTGFACEDVDVMARMSAQGWSGLYDPRILVYHHHGRKTHADALDLMKQYDRGRGAYFTKCILNPELRAVYLLGWFTRIVSQPPTVTAREIASGIRYLLQHAKDTDSRNHI